MSWSVSVPATTANLGPGYDKLGLALDLRLRATAEQSTRWSVITEGEGAGELEEDESNLLAQAGIQYSQRLGLEPQALAIRETNPIPLGRGLGSSAAAIVAGMALAQLADTGSLDHDTIFREAVALEGHADNVAAAVYGGLREITNRSEPESRQLPIAAGIQVILVIPEATKSTAQMREVLPAEIPPEDQLATDEAYRAVLSGLATGDPAALARTADDRRHQPYRLKALPGSAGIFELLQQQPNIAGVYLSGAGTTVAGWVLDGNDPTGAVRKAMVDQGWAATVRLARPDPDGVRVES